ncbi:MULTISPECIES: hypothetical protein [Paenibacillus]|uniref:hypothetical protein n=1 Tax=Paenibacillus TaxID=44249 RepID=UPI0022B91F7C|nr:hypothetical protein [Paenibacillus caseinilyticus]MCZ8524067.1 hypothetical protein [Paenibacillus caseinilyticus]
MKWMKGLLKLGITAAVTSVCCVALTFLAVNTYVEMLLDQYHIQRPAGQKIDWNGFAGRFSAQLGLGTGGAAGETTLPAKERDLAVAAQPQPNTPSSGSSGTTSGTGGAAGSGAGTPGTEGSTAPDPYRKPDDAVAVWSRQSSSQLQGSEAAQQETDKKVVMSGEEFNKLKDGLSESDKSKVFGMLYNRVPPEEMQKISLLLEDGITAAELKELEQVLQKHLKPEEYTQLLGMIDKKTP